MASLGGFLQGLGLAYGNSLIQGQNFEEQQARTSFMKSEAMMQGLQAQQMQQKVKTEKELGDFISSELKLKGADATLPQNQAQMFTKAAGLAAASGDFASMTEMNSLAHSSQQQARDEAAYAAQQQARAKEDLGSSAQAYANNPTAEGANDLARKAIAAGQNPATIPLPGTPAFAAWANNQQLAGMDSKDRANFVQKAADLKAKREEQWQIHADNVALRRESMAQNAALREQMIGLRRDEAASRAPSHVDIGGATYQWDPSGQVKGERLASDGRYVKLGAKITATQENNTVALGGAAAEAARNLRQMSGFSVGTANSPFTHLGDASFTDALAKTGTQALTPEQVQMFQTSSAGLGLELARVATLGAGRGANQSVINEMQKLTTPTSGDTNLTMAYKLSTAAQIALTRMESSPKPSNADAAAKWDETKSYLQSIPTPEKIQRIAGTKGGQALAKINQTYNDLQGKIDKMSDEGLPGSGDLGSGHSAPPLPSDISTLVNKYGSQ